MNNYLDDLRNVLKFSHDIIPLEYKEKLEQIFYEHFHVDSSEAIEIFEKIKTNINEKIQTIIINGYKGCGKTTFAYYLQKKLTFCSHMIDFGIDVDTELLTRGPLIQYISNNITDDIISNKKITNRLLKEFYDDDKYHKYLSYKFDQHAAFFHFLSFLKKNVSIINQDKNIFKNTLKKKLKEKCPKIADLFSIIILWDIAYRLVNNKRKEKTFIILLII